MKWLDDRNKKAQERALKGDPPQPFYKSFIDQKKACPFCSKSLRMRGRGFDTEFETECDCSFWEYKMYPTSFWYRTPKSPLAE